MALFNCAGGNGGGGGGTSDYEQLSNLPQINNNILIGNKSASDLGLVAAVTGKGLSSNDYTNADKSIVDGVTSALAGKVDKVTGKGLSTNDYDNTAKGIVDGVTSALAGKVDTSSVGSANGVAELDANGRVPSSQLPSYVDDVLEYADLAHFPATGETGKIYIAEDTNKTYRWSGSGFVEISESLALGETSSTAYAGNKGKANADAIAAIKDGTNLDSFGDVEDAFNYLTFEGTQADWNLLSTAEKKKYKQAIFTDDYVDNPVGNLNALTTTDKSSCVGAINEVNEGLTNLIKYVDVTITDTITLTANVPKYLSYTASVEISKIIGVRLISATGDSSLDGTVGAYLGAYNFIHLLATSNKNFTSITARLFYLG